jgi:hypothetical protein
LIDKLAFLVRFWELKARHAAMGQPLSASEQVELLSLMQLVTSDCKMPVAGHCERPRNALPAQLIGEGTILSVEIRYVCAAALLVASAKEMTPGERTIVRTGDAVAGAEFSLPCTIAWVHEGSPCIMALAIDGEPTRTILGESMLGEPRGLRMFSIGRQARLVG